jgi:hypothetical protein
MLHCYEAGRCARTAMACQDVGVRQSARKGRFRANGWNGSKTGMDDANMSGANMGGGLGNGERASHHLNAWSER